MVKIQTTYSADLPPETIAAMKAEVAARTPVPPAPAPTPSILTSLRNIEARSVAPDVDSYLVAERDQARHYVGADLIERRIRRCFMQFDPNHTGAIDMANFAPLLAALGDDRPEKDVQHELDAHVQVDNSVGTISYLAFVAWWARRESS